jgi:hypothetical protein
MYKVRTFCQFFLSRDTKKLTLICKHPGFSEKVLLQLYETLTHRRICRNTLMHIMCKGQLTGIDELG